MRILYTLILMTTLTLLPMGAAFAGGHSSRKALMEELIVESASTPTAHQAVVKYFQARAARLRSAAEHQRALVDAYAGDYSGDDGDAMLRDFAEGNASELASKLDEAAAEYDRRAAEHQK